MKNVFVLAAAFGTAMAMPAFMDDPVALENARALLERSIGSRDDALGLSKAQTNCGPTPCLVFDEKDQFVSLTGPNAYASPGPGDIRGPCPGLNAAANHGFLPRNG